MILNNDSLVRTFRNILVAIRKKIGSKNLRKYVESYYEYYTGLRLIWMILRRSMKKLIG